MKSIIIKTKYKDDICNFCRSNKNLLQIRSDSNLSLAVVICEDCIKKLNDNIDKIKKEL